MNIAVTAFATDSGRSGLSVYLRALYEAMLREPLVKRVTFYGPRGVRAHMPLAGGADVRVVELPAALDRRSVNVLWHQTAFPAMLLRDRPDVVHFPAANRRVALTPHIPSVGTVHDLADLAVPGKYGVARRLYLTHAVPRLLCGLDRIVAISSATRDDLLDVLPPSHPPIDVVPNGLDHETYRPQPRRTAEKKVRTVLDVPLPYVFYPARLEHPAKNHVRLIRAFAAARRRAGFPHRLVLAGAPWNGSEVVLREVDEHSDCVRHVGFVSASMLPALYSAADLTVLPSLYEGFGLPVLESMACGTPVLASRASSIPEVAGDAADLVDATDEEALTASLVALLSDEERRGELSRRGLARAASFTWQATARGTLAALVAARARTR